MKRLIFILILGSVGCVENFNPDINAQESILYFIDGIITDEEPAAIQIGRSIVFDGDKDDIEYITGAVVTLSDDLNNHEILSDTAIGSRKVYLGKNPGIIGRSYSVEIQLPSGEIIMSTPQLLKPSASVGELSIEHAEQVRISDAGVDIPVPGLNLNLNMDQTDTLSRYYKWTINGTYKFTSPLRSFFEPNNNIVCYIGEEFGSFFILGESVSTDRDVFNKNLTFIDGGVNFVEGYSVQVVQYALTEDAYDYWKKIDDQQRNVGSVFDAPPALILGNLFLANGDEPILGFFEVSSVSRKRIFIKPTDFPITPEPDLITCIPEEPPSYNPFNDDRQPKPPAPWCIDCTVLENSTRVIPDYWPVE